MDSRKWQIGVPRLLYERGEKKNYWVFLQLNKFIPEPMEENQWRGKPAGQSMGMGSGLPENRKTKGGQSWITMNLPKLNVSSHPRWSA